MVSIITEPGFSGSNWCQTIKESLVEQLRLKRIPFSEENEYVSDGSDGVFLIASDYSFIKTAVNKLNSAGIQPIVICNQHDRIPGCIYSCVCSDVNFSMKELLEVLVKEGVSRIAVYGVNPSSASDISRVDSIYVWKNETVKHLKVFTNDGSLEKCFGSFLPEINSFEAVICVNNYAAVSLVKRLKKAIGGIPEGLKIISCVKTEISDIYAKDIISLNINCEQYGKTAVMLLETLNKNPYLSSVSMFVKPTFGEAEVKEACDKVDIDFFPIDTFYKDKELIRVLTADKILSAADPTDRLLLKGLVEGRSFIQLSEECFLAESSIKYRIKKLAALCPTKSKKELTEIAAEYFSQIGIEY